MARYSNPRTWAVYDLGVSLNKQRFRHGNHPVRQQELIREFAQIEVKVIEIFTSKDAAKTAEIKLNANKGSQ